MQIDAAESLGLVAGFIGSFAFAPQALKIIRGGDTSGVSTLTYMMVLTGAVLWGVYGAMREAPSIMLWNAVAAVLAATVLLVKAQRR